MEELNEEKRLQLASEKFKRNTLMQHTKSILLDFDIKKLLKNSCYYISAGADITPIMTFKDSIQSYVFCDLELINGVKGINNKFDAILIRLKDKLIQQGFVEIQKLYLDPHIFDRVCSFESFRYVYSPKKYELSLWVLDRKVYSLLYIHGNNVVTYRRLYIKHNITPKVLCEILPDGGYLRSTTEIDNGTPRLTPKEKSTILPEYALGGFISVADRNLYEEIDSDVPYFGDYPNQYSGTNKLSLYKRKDV